MFLFVFLLQTFVTTPCQEVLVPFFPTTRAHFLFWGHLLVILTSLQTFLYFCVGDLLLGLTENSDNGIFFT